MEAKMNKYDAFISYRHCEPDKFVAETVHKMLESYELPGNIKKKNKAEGLRTKITRVFRDEEELPLASNLEDPIVEALKNSEWLIVICSPRLKESLWCQKEIETFIELHGRDKVLAVLVEGEPNESFPIQITQYEKVTLNSMGVSTTEMVYAEPLAANARGESNKERKNNLKNEILRLLAPMFSVSFDDLKQRHREQKFRKALFYTSFASVVSLMIAAGSLFAAFVINQQKDQIEEQADRIELQSQEIGAQAIEIQDMNNVLIESQARSVASDAVEYMNEDNRSMAVLTAYQSLTEYEGVEMPYTDEGLYALNLAAQRYNGDTGLGIPQYIASLPDTVEDMMTVADRYLLVKTSNSSIFLIEPKGGAILYVFPQYVDNFDDIEVLLDGRLIYLNDTEVYELDYVDWSVTELFSVPNIIINKFRVFEDYAFLGSADGVYVYSMETAQQVSFIETQCRVTDIYTTSDGQLFIVGNGSTSSVSEYEIMRVESDYETIIFDKYIEDQVILDIYPSYSGIAVLSKCGTSAYDTWDEEEDFFEWVLSLDVYSQVALYDFEDCSTLWTKRIDMSTGSDPKIFVAITNYGNRVTIVFDNYFEIMDAANGDSLYENTVGSFATCEQDGAYLSLYGSDGVGSVIDPVTLSLFRNIRYLNTGFDDIANVVTLDYVDACVTYRDGSSELYIYSYVSSNSLTECDKEDVDKDFFCEYYGVEECYGNEYLVLGAKEQAESLGVENPDYVVNVAYFNDNKYAAIVYLNKKMVIIDVDNSEVIDSYDLKSTNRLVFDYTIKSVSGPDECGNTYISFDDCAYVFSENAGLVNKIFDFQGLTNDGKSLIVGTVSGSYIFDIYDKDDLLSWAEEYLDNYLPGWDD